MTTPATREEVVELMAKAVVQSGLSSGWKGWIDDAKAVLTALEAAGLCIVPVEATEGRLRKIARAICCADGYGADDLDVFSEGEPAWCGYLDHAKAVVETDPASAYKKVPKT
jgi:hypothetical protein